MYVRTYIRMYVGTYVCIYVCKFFFVYLLTMLHHSEVTLHAVM